MKPNTDLPPTPSAEASKGASADCAPMPGYASLWGKILRKWDWWIYRKACGSLRRMALDNPGMSYLMELNIRGWNEQLDISPELKRSTEAFHAAMRDHQHNDQVKPRRTAD